MPAFLFINITMAFIKQLHRKDYPGEDISIERKYEQGRWIDNNEFLPNTIANRQISNRAVVIGNGTSRLNMDLSIIARNTAGLRGRLKLQSYGCNALYRDFTPDFLVATGDVIISEIVNSGYCEDHIVYSTQENIVGYPEHLYFIPQNPPWNAGSLATYMACFDGHKTVFLLGFDGNDAAGFNSNVYAGTTGYYKERTTIDETFWNLTMTEVFNTYPDVDFVRVAPAENFRMPEAWRYCTNLRQITTRQFVYEADL